MKKILVISPASYPVADAESIVNIKLLRALSEDGRFEIDLISKRNKWFTYPSGKIEAYGVKCKHNIIVEVGNTLTPKVIWQSLMSLFTFGVCYRGSHWAYAALPVVEQFVKRNHYDYVLTKNSPSFLLGWYLKRKYSIKWCASWNDPFPYEKYPKPYAGGLKSNSFVSRLMIKRMRQADMHIFPSERLGLYMNNYLNICVADQMIVCPHIVLPDETVTRDINNNELRIIHSGNLQNPRSPKSLLQGLRLALNKNPKMKVTISIMGKMSDEDLGLAHKMELDGSILFLKTVEYTESLKILSQYHVAAVIEADCEEGIFMPTKVSDCMQQGIPIAAISPMKGNLHDLYNEGYVSYFADIKSPEAISEMLIKMYSDLLEGKMPNKSSIKKEFLAESIVKQYLEL